MFIEALRGTYGWGTWLPKRINGGTKLLSCCICASSRGLAPENGAATTLANSYPEATKRGEFRAWGTSDPMFSASSERAPRRWLTPCDTAQATVACITRIQKPGMLILELSECVESGAGRSGSELYCRLDSLSFHTSKLHPRPDADETQSGADRRRSAMTSGLRW